MKKYWIYDHISGWEEIERPIYDSSEEMEDFLFKQDYLPNPHCIVGDEFSYLEIYEHPFKEEYLFHFLIDDLSKVLYAKSMPAMMHVMEELNTLLSLYFRTCAIIEGMQNE